MNFKKILAVVLAVIMLLSVVGCGSDNDNSDNSTSSSQNVEAATKEYITLLYSSSDSLNPYKAETVLNRRLASLLYDPLVKVDDEFQPQFILAKSIDFLGKECLITLKKAFFSDATPVTAADVVFSLKLALESELTVYKEQLSIVKDYKAQEDGTVKITLTKADPYFANLLDFPIIKKDSDNLKDQNNIILPPIGSGRYVFDQTEKILLANQSHVAKAPSIKTVKLINAPDETVVKYNLEVANVDIFYSDLTDGIIPPMSGNASRVELNNFVYLGLNLGDSVLKDPKIRYALSSAVDRTAICNDAYYSYALPATGLFNATFEDAGSLQNLTKTPDLENVVAILKEIGYNSKDEEGFFVNDKGKTLEFKLVAFSGNERRLKSAELVKQQLEAAGFKIKLVSLEWDKYVSALENGDFDLYIAETRLLNNMDVSELVTSGGSLAYGIPKPKVPTVTDKNNKTDKADEDKTENDNDEDEKQNEPLSAVPLLDNAVQGFYNEQLSLVDIINAFNAEMPLIPLCHRQGITVGSPKINVDGMSTLSDAYFNISNIK